MALIEQQGLEPPPERAFVKWRRADAPELGAVHLVVLVFPTDRLRLDAPVSTAKKPVLLFEAAPPSKALEVWFSVSREGASSLEDKFLGSGVVPCFRTDLPNGEAIWTVLREVDFDMASIPPVDAWARSAKPLDADGLPKIGATRDNLTAILWNAPKDGEALRIIEIGGISITRHAP